jgi:16S rRNA pseudouridine516 synthase
MSTRFPATVECRSRSTEKLHRILTSQGLGSRRYCEALIKNGDVHIQGEPKTDPEEKFPTEGLTLTIEGKYWMYQKNLYVMLHKPVGYECSHRPSHHPSIYHLLPEPFIRRGLQCVGRLDYDTSGLLLLSDDGHFIHAMTSPKKDVGKTYQIRTRFPVTEEDCQRLLTGVALRGETHPAIATECFKRGEDELSMTITEGRYHQVKRMIAAIGNEVVTLHRSKIGSYELPADLPVGSWKPFDIPIGFA